MGDPLPGFGRPCPVCGKGWIHRLPACPTCWTAVPQATKVKLSHLAFGGPAYREALAEALVELAAALDAG